MLYHDFLSLVDAFCNTSSLVNPDLLIGLIFHHSSTCFGVLGIFIGLYLLKGVCVVRYFNVLRHVGFTLGIT
jgi:hypothetical protein